MKIRVSKIRGVVEALPGVFVVMPKNDYLSSVSRSPMQVSRKAWNLTGSQMKTAIENFEATEPDVRRAIAAAR